MFDGGYGGHGSLTLLTLVRLAIVLTEAIGFLGDAQFL